MRTAILRDYQDDLSLRARKALGKDGSVLIQLGTGGGKTVVAGDIMERAVAKGIKPLFLSDRIEISGKSKQTFEDKFGINCQLISSDTKTLYKADAYVSLVETFYRRCMSGWFPSNKIGLIFCDEAHSNAFTKVLKLFDHAYKVGLTATPSSMAFKMNKVYNKIITGPKNSELVKQGHLVKCIEIGSDKLLSAQIHAGEFSVESQRAAFGQFDVDKLAFDLWMRHARHKKTLWFNIDIEHNNSVIERHFKDTGIKYRCVDNKTSKDDRRDWFKEFEEGDCEVLFNVGIATKGYDNPKVECVVANLMTASLTKWLQIIGRGGRSCPEIGKESFFLIDTGNNGIRHGGFEEDIDWEHLFNNPGDVIKKEPTKTAKLCPNCHANIYNMYAEKCHVCLIPIERNKLLSLSSQMPKYLMEKDTRDMTMKELHLYAKFSGRKPGWAHFQFQLNCARNRKFGGFRR